MRLNPGIGSLLFEGFWVILQQGKNWLECETDHPPLSSTEVKNAWSCASNAPYAFAKIFIFLYTF